MKYDRKVAILGRSMLNLAGISRELGYMTFPDGLLMPVEQINKLPHNKVVILTTGSQGEPLSALSRIANHEYKQMRIVPGDTVIVSATPIPGNERSVANTINALFLRGADVIYGREAGVHVSGHACRQEQMLMINLCRPKFFMPIHGEYRMLVRHGEIATECGVLPENVFVMENGEILELTSNEGCKAGRVKSGIILIDSSRSWRIDEAIVEERRHLAEYGLVTVSLAVDKSGNILSGPEVALRGMILPGNVSAEVFVGTLKSQVRFIISSRAQIPDEDEFDLRDYLVSALQQYFVEKMHTSPLVQVILQRITAGTSTGGRQVVKSSPVPKDGPLCG